MKLIDKVLFINEYMKEIEEEVKDSGKLLVVLHFGSCKLTASVFAKGNVKDRVRFYIERESLTIRDNEAVTFSVDEAKTLLERILWT